MLLDDIKTKFLELHPIVYYNVNGEQFEHSEDERLSIIDEWSVNYLDTSFDRIRFLRNGLLGSSDWTQMPDSPVDQAAWAEYRQLLRDFPETITTVEDLENPVWPTPPE